MENWADSSNSTNWLSIKNMTNRAPGGSDSVSETVLVNSGVDPGGGGSPHRPLPSNKKTPGREYLLVLAFL